MRAIFHGKFNSQPQAENDLSLRFHFEHIHTNLNTDWFLIDLVV